MKKLLLLLVSANVFASGFFGAGGGGSGSSIGGGLSGATNNSVLFVNPDNTFAQDNPKFTYTKSTSTMSVPNLIVSALTAGVCHTDGTGAVTSSLIVNADISSSAAIARSKVATGTAYRILANDSSGNFSENAALTAARALTSDANGQLAVSSTTATQLGYLNAVTSDVQTQINGKEPTQTKGSVSTTTTGLTIGNGTSSTVGPNVTVNVQNATTGQNGLLTSTDWNTFNGKQAGPLTGDVTTSGAAATIANNAVTNAKLANIATQTFKGRTTASTGNVEDLTATQATAILNAFVGDSGSGGTKGLVPAPASGDAAANKFLKANGSWSTLDPNRTESATVTCGPASAIVSQSNSFIASIDNRGASTANHCLITWTSGIWSAKPRCVASNANGDPDSHGTLITYSTNVSVTVRPRTNAGSDATNMTFDILCHGPR